MAHGLKSTTGSSSISMVFTRSRGQTATTTLSAGWHSIHVPYFQGPPLALALVLCIQPPGEAMRPFNLNEFVPAN